MPSTSESAVLRRRLRRLLLLLHLPSTKPRAECLQTLSEILATCKKIAEASPVPGLPGSIGIAQAIVDTAVQASTNRENAMVLATRVCELLESLAKQSPAASGTSIEDCDVSTDTATPNNVEKFRRQLKEVEAMITRLTLKRAWYKTLLSANRDKRTVDEIIKSLEDSVKLFGVDMLIDIGNVTKETNTRLRGMERCDTGTKIQVFSKMYRKIVPARPKSEDRVDRTLTVTVINTEEIAVAEGQNRAHETLIEKMRQEKEACDAALAEEVRSHEANITKASLERDALLRELSEAREKLGLYEKGRAEDLAQKRRIGEELTVLQLEFCSQRQSLASANAECAQLKVDAASAYLQLTSESSLMNDRLEDQRKTSQHEIDRFQVLLHEDRTRLEDELSSTREELSTAIQEKSDIEKVLAEELLLRSQTVSENKLRTNLQQKTSELASARQLVHEAVSREENLRQEFSTSLLKLMSADEEREREQERLRVALRTTGSALNAMEAKYTTLFTTKEARASEQEKLRAELHTMATALKEWNLKAVCPGLEGRSLSDDLLRPGASLAAGLVTGLTAMFA